MKLTSASTLALAVAPVLGFPANSPLWETATKRQTVAAPQGAGALPLAPPPFDAKAQYISTTGQYKFVAPSSTDVRGQCPGLNAMANHGYLPHNGVATIQQFIQATNKVFGMALDLGGFLAIYGATVDGSGTSWSLLGGPHQGIGGSHNNYEADSSPLKADLSQYGNNYKLLMGQFKELYNMQPDASTANYNLEVLRAFRGKRFQESISGNPYFTYNPFAGIEVSQAAYTFIYRFMSNKSAEYPEGILNKKVLKSFMSIQGPENDLKWVPGNERIPDNWYTRNSADQYSIPYFQTDILYFAETVPQVLEVGCNMGKVNTYNTFTPEQLTNGAITAQDVASNPLCYSTAFAAFEAENALGLNAAQTAKATAALQAFETALGVTCPSVQSFNLTEFQAACPGTSLYGGPTAPVAPGAVQSALPY